MRLLFLGLALIMSAGVGAVVLSRRRRLADWTFGFLVALGAGTGLLAAARVLGGGTSRAVTIHPGLPGGPWVAGIDALSAFFLVIVLGVGAVVAIYGTGYLAEERHRSVAAQHFGFSALLSSLALVVTARSALPFLIAWEAMSICGYLLVVFEHEQPEVRRSGLVYLVATHAGTLALFLLFAVWGRYAADFTFDSLAAGASALPKQGAVVLLLALFGFGIKAGLVPFHFWLPGAHSAAPSHVSAIMSGVVIKMGIYGLIRVGFLLGVTPVWWGWTIISLGLASGILGVLWALAQHDMKRLLAYHSVENIGIILLGMGVGWLGVSYGQPTIAAIGFAGAVLHTLNHALFKSLLFFGAGSVLRATGTREIDRLGGLARVMPLTWVSFLIGAAAIVGLPPLNGFVSEWTVYQALFRSGSAEGSIRLAVLGAVGLALIGALALACFVKVAGAVFLGTPRNDGNRGAREAGLAMTTPMFVLASACAIIGMRPLLAFRPALDVGALLARNQGPVIEGAFADVLRAAEWIGIVAVGAVLLSAITWAVLGRLHRARPVAVANTWGCGYPLPDERMQYTAASFAAPLLDAYASIAGVQIHEGGSSFHTHPQDLVLEHAIFPLWNRVRSLAERLRPIQQGRLHLYLLYVIAIVLLLLLYLVMD